MVTALPQTLSCTFCALGAWPTLSPHPRLCRHRGLPPLCKLARQPALTWTAWPSLPRSRCFLTPLPTRPSQLPARGTFFPLRYPQQPLPGFGSLSPFLPTLCITSAPLTSSLCELGPRTRPPAPRPRLAAADQRVAGHAALRGPGSQPRRACRGTRSSAPVLHPSQMLTTSPSARSATTRHALTLVLHGAGGRCVRTFSIVRITSVGTH